MTSYGTSKENLIVEGKRSRRFRMLLGVNGLLVLAVTGLIIALVIVSINEPSDENGIQTDGQTGRRVTVPECPVNPGSDTPELDRARCVLDSYPLTDG